MIHQEIHLIPLDDILLERSDRQRAELDWTHIKSLAEDIPVRDLIHIPILESSTNRLVAGEHRLEAFRFNRDSAVPCPFPAYADWTLLPIRYADNPTEGELVALELVENIKNKGLEWKDEARAVRKLHSLLGKTARDLAAYLAIPEKQVAMCLKTGEALASNHALASAASSMNTAYNLLLREQERASAVQIDKLKRVSLTSLDPFAEAPLLPEEEEEDQPTPTAFSTDSAAAECILPTPFEEFAASYTSLPFTFLHCDFPYGTKLFDSPGQNTRLDWEQYDDDPKVYWKLLAALAANQHTLIAETCHIVFWYSPNLHEDTLDFFAGEMEDFSIEPFPLIWHKSDNSGLLPDPSRYGRRTYEVALLLRRGDPKIVQATALSFAHPGNFPEKVHRSQKPLALLRHFFRMFVDGSTRMLDPTCGSGTSLQAAVLQHATTTIGCEINPKMQEHARVGLSDALLLVEDEATQESTNATN